MPARSVSSALRVLSGLGLLSVPTLAAETYKVDPVHSSALFRVKHLGVSNYYGHFTDISGTFVLDEKNASACSVEVEVKTESVATHNEKRDQHLKSPDFFNAKEFPVLSFKSKQVKAAGKGIYEVTGDLTIRGVTKPLTTKVTLVGSGKGMQEEYRAGFETIFTIKRSEFGINYMPQGLGEEVQITVSLEGFR